jgi:tripartite-type tricarboxylate transporter receptor subunit TctC
MTITRRAALGTLPAATLLAAIGRSAWAAEGQPLEVARMITGFAAGGTADVISRRAAAKMTPGYAHNMYVENKTGAGGQIAVQYVKAQPADGATVLQTPMSMLCIYPHIYKTLPYDPVADLTPVSLGCTFDLAFGVGPEVPASVKTINDYMAWAKANPQKRAFGVPAAGSIAHFMGVLMGRAGGVDLQQIAYRGTLPAIQAMIGGNIPAVCGPVGEFTQFVLAGKCRLLATAGAKRSRFAPDVPTLGEQGLRNMVYRDWFAFYLPPKASPERVQRLNSSLVSALAAPDVVEALAKMGLESEASTPAQLAAMQRKELEMWGPLVKSIGFSADT